MLPLIQCYQWIVGPECENFNARLRMPARDHQEVADSAVNLAVLFPPKWFLTASHAAEEIQKNSPVMLVGVPCRSPVVM